MRLKTLALENFRNHTGYSAEFSDEHSVNYIVGPNARGKTNLLEAIFLLALTKSFRGQKMAELINWDCDYARVKADFEMDGDEGTKASGPERLQYKNSAPLQLEIFLGKPPQPQKVLKRNNVKTSAENFIGSLKVVFFHPEDLNILYLGPDLRRRYLDVLIIQEKPAYYRALRSYKKTLEHRNALLRGIREGRNSANELDIWDRQLVEFGDVIIRERTGAVKFMKENLQETYRKISQGNEEISVEYKLSWFAQNGFDQNADGQKEAYLDFLAGMRRRDIEAGTTTSGPHRDDLVFHLGGRPLYEHASRGEYRSIVLALKMLEMDYHRRISGTRPLVLLDDVFSELDDARRSTLVGAIQDHQVFITSTKVGEHFMERTHRSLTEHAREPNIIKVGAE